MPEPVPRSSLGDEDDEVAGLYERAGRRTHAPSRPAGDWLPVACSDGRLVVMASVCIERTKHMSSTIFAFHGQFRHPHAHCRAGRT